MVFTYHLQQTLKIELSQPELFEHGMKIRARHSEPTTVFYELDRTTDRLTIPEQDRIEVDLMHILELASRCMRSGQHFIVHAISARAEPVAHTFKRDHFRRT